MRYYHEKSGQLTKTKIRCWVHAVQATMEASRGRDANPFVILNALSNLAWQQLPVSKTIERTFHLVDLYTIGYTILSSFDSIVPRESRGGKVPYLKLSCIYSISALKQYNARSWIMMPSQNALMQLASLYVLIPRARHTYENLNQDEKETFSKSLKYFTQYCICYTAYLYGNAKKVPYLMDNRKSRVVLNNWFNVYDIGHLFGFASYYHLSKIRK